MSSAHLIEQKLNQSSPPKSPAQLLAAEAFKNVERALTEADRVIKEAMGPALDLEKELPGDGAHPLSVLISAREQLAGATRGVQTVLEFGLDSPFAGRLVHMADPARIGSAMGQYQRAR